MNRITEKLRSEKGASITYALLLFLICAVISSVILVSGTTAAGRMSGMADSEQTYYSVTSTAKLIRDIMENGQETVIVLGEGEEQTAYIVRGKQLVEINEEMGTANLSLAEYAASKVYQSSNVTDTFAVGGTPGVLSNAVAGVTIKESIDIENDNVKFTVLSRGYALVLRFTTNTTTKPIETENETAGEKITYTWTLSRIGAS